jgi:hypothetical protein
MVPGDSVVGRWRKLLVFRRFECLLIGEKRAGSSDGTGALFDGVAPPFSIAAKRQ